MGAFKEPHGGELKDLYLQGAAAEAEKQAAGSYPSWDLTERQLCDIELILNGAFSPLEGFLDRDDYEAVLKGMRLVNGVLWPMPITLDVSEDFAADLSRGDKVAISADDYGREEVAGELLRLDFSRIKIRRNDDRVGDVNVHFPQLGYQLRPL